VTRWATVALEVPGPPAASGVSEGSRTTERPRSLGAERLEINTFSLFFPKQIFSVEGNLSLANTNVPYKIFPSGRSCISLKPLQPDTVDRGQTTLCFMFKLLAAAAQGQKTAS